MITKHKNILSKGYTTSCSTEVLLIDSVLKTNPWKYKTKDLNWQKIIGSYYKKELLLSKLWMIYYPELDSQINKNVKIKLDLSNYDSKIELEGSTGIDTSNFASKGDFIDLKVEVGKLDINKLVNVLNGMNNVKTKVENGLDI